jgi:hypothetical protein
MPPAEMGALSRMPHLDTLANEPQSFRQVLGTLTEKSVPTLSTGLLRWQREQDDGPLSKSGGGWPPPTSGRSMHQVAFGFLQELPWLISSTLILCRSTKVCATWKCLHLFNGIDPWRYSSYFSGSFELFYFIQCGFLDATGKFGLLAASISAAFNRWLRKSSIPIRRLPRSLDCQRTLEQCLSLFQLLAFLRQGSVGLLQRLDQDSSC